MNFEFYDHFWVMKTDAYGDEEWSIESGGNLWDEAQDIVKLSDDSYIVTEDIFVINKLEYEGNASIFKQSLGGNNDTATGITLSKMKKWLPLLY